MSMGILYIIAGVQEYFRRKIWFKEQYLIIVKILLAIIVFMICLFGSMNGERVYVNADEWNNPVEYYNKYGNNAVFKADGKTKGEIYFCSVGNTSNSGTKYKTLGYKMSVKDENGNILQKVNYKFGGCQLRFVSMKKTVGQEYRLYSISLYNMKKSLNSQTFKKFDSGKCTITLDACMTLKVNGVDKGGMNDNGQTWGKVYDTYTGIANAAGWSDSALSSLHSYYGKTVSGLFHRIEVEKSTGISGVSGGGNYCYGTLAKISATIQNGYSFQNWNNDGNMNTSTYSFWVNSSGKYTAYAQAQSVEVKFWKNAGEDGNDCKTMTYVYGGVNQSFPTVDWKRKGYHMTGWANIPDAVNAGYEQGYGISDSWIMASMPSKDIYAVWNENQYTIEYDTGISVKVKYSDTVRLPEQHMCIGWLPGEKYPDVRYLPGEEIKVAQLCELMGIDYAENAVIPLYALWEHEPTIQAKDMFFSVKQAHDGMITENLIGSMIYATDVEDGDIAFGNNQTNYLILRNFDDKRIKEVVDKAVMDILIEAKDSYGNVTQKTITLTFKDTTIKDSTESFGKIRFISEKYYGKNKAGGLMENSRWLNDPEFNSLLRQALAI